MTLFQNSLDSSLSMSKQKTIRSVSAIAERYIPLKEKIYMGLLRDRKISFLCQVELDIYGRLSFLLPHLCQNGSSGILEDPFSYLLLLGLVLLGIFLISCWCSV